ncbi:MAG TPA: ABC transporter ATP-binding protein [Thermodesulfobacteriota bacterium]|nr:ABC transporter ATP-binding protein [Thermodesulfobacteriota bacterium]
MNGDVAISVKNLSKSYRMYGAPSERLKELLHPFGKKYHREFWALKDVSLEIKRGETVGIVGRNGSGKSTLLQVICGVMPPTKGTVNVRGRISALLELGAGFHREFTGRENVYMSGAIMGYSAKEMGRRFKEIADFADIGAFIDQPVKTYSSGMHVRLAFSVAISVEPDILVVDEALAVGDEAFQRKCYSRIHDMQKRGATILFVTHSASVVVDLCNKAMLFEKGELLLGGAPKTVVAKYHKLLYAPPNRVDAIREEIRASSSAEEETDKAHEETPEVKKPKRHIGPEKAATGGKKSGAHYDPNMKPKSTVVYESRGALIEDPHITTVDGKKVNVLAHGEEYIYTYRVRFEEPSYGVRFGMMIKTKTGIELGGMVTHPRGEAVEYVEKGAVMTPRFTFRCGLQPGVYFLNAGVVGIVGGAETYLHRLEDVLMFRVQPAKDLLFTGMVDFSTEEPTFVKGGLVYDKR